MKRTPDAAPVGMVETLDHVACADHQDWPQLGRYRAANAALGGAAQKVVFLGDSITEMWQAADPAVFAAGVVNRGISGQTTPQMLLRFMADVVQLRPAVVHLMAGTNDIAGNTGPNTLADYQRNILAMTALARVHGIRAIIASVPPMREVPWRPEVGSTLARVAQLNRWLRKMADAHDLVYADYHGALAAADGAMRAELTRDGVHLEAAGYRLLRPLATAAIEAALR